jgi:hypothetical protein
MTALNKCALSIYYNICIGKVLDKDRFSKPPYGGVIKENIFNGYL